VRKRIVSAMRRMEFVSGRMSYIILRSRWRSIIAFNVHVPSEDRSTHVKDSFYEKLGRVFGQVLGTI
jgi:hypothetical protein